MPLRLTATPVGTSAGGPPALVPTGVAVAKSGNVYVSSDIRNAMYKLTPPTP